TGAFRSLPFSACGACDGLFLSNTTIQGLLDEDYRKKWTPEPPQKESTALDALLWALDYGVPSGLFLYLLTNLWPRRQN
ncbi:MAG: hypothetical protein V3T72_03190, partial [Thermoanaerobaculia bacterium]